MFTLYPWPQFEWVYMTGDLPAHNVWNQSRDDQLYVLKTLVGLLKKYLPDKIIFPTLGNHESAPVNRCVPTCTNTPNSLPPFGHCLIIVIINASMQLHMT